MSKDIFISYARKDTRIVNRTINELVKYGYEVWIDTRSIQGGALWQEDINKAIENCNIFLFFVSSHSIKSANVRHEFHLAVEKNKKIVPILLEETRIPEDMRYPIMEIQWIKLDDDFHDAIKRLFVALGNNREAKPLKQDKVKNILSLSGDKGVEDLIQAVEKIINLVSSSQYTRAVTEGARVRERLIKLTEPNNLDRSLLQGGFDVWYAHALMYAGNTDSAMTLLTNLINKFEKLFSSNSNVEANPRFFEILGRAHNHLGYINWMNLAHYEVALSEFQKSIKILQLGGKGLKRELATAYDNMGRVYAQLGFQPRAVLLIEHGKQLREQSNDWDRLGLSLTSNAIAYLGFGQPHQALQSSETAFTIFKQKSSVIGERGIGLALLTKAQSIRNIILQAYNVNQVGWSLRHIEMALKILRRAEKAFLHVGEEVRLFQVYNELGCIYRERATLLKQAGDTDKAFGSVDLAIQFLGESIRIAKGNAKGYKYHAYFIDACEDMAQVYFINGNNKKAKEWLEQAEQTIPRGYKLTNGKISKEILVNKCYEEFWQQLGKIYFLRGQMISDLFFAGQRKKNLSPSLQSAVENYVIAASYFGRFMERPLNSNNMHLYPRYKPNLKNHWKLASNIYNVLSVLELEDLKMVKQQILPRLYSHYHLKPSWLELFNEDGLDFLLTISGISTLQEAI